MLLRSTASLVFRSRGAGVDSGGQHRTYSRLSIHTGYGAAEVDGVPGTSGGAGDASSVGDGSGRQHRISSMISTHTVYGAAEVVGVPGISGGAGDARGVDVGSGRQHRNSSRSTHTGYCASEVYGVPDSSGGADDASGVGDGSGSQHRHRNTATGALHIGTASNALVWTSMDGAYSVKAPQAEIETYACAYGEPKPRAAPRI